MLTSLALAIFLAQQSTVPARVSRAAFAEAMATIQEGDSADKVRKILGKPDDVWKPSDSLVGLYPGTEEWCYGSSGHLSLPTLGYVLITNGKVNYVIGGSGTPPDPRVISEDELEKHLQRVFGHPKEGEWYAYQPEDDSSRMIAVTDDLVPLGVTKIGAVLREFVRVDGDLNFGDDWLFWVVRALFVPKKPNSSFRYPNIFGVRHEPSLLQNWSTYPVIIVDDIPINLNRGTGGAGPNEAFQTYFKDEVVNWRLRDKPLRPPGDPFSAVDDISSSQFWTHAYVADRGSRFGSSEPLAPLALQTILELVRSAYLPKTAIRSLDAEKLLANREMYHKEYLALGCHFDPATGTYVRRDGPTVPDKLGYRPPAVQILTSPHLTPTQKPGAH